MNMELEDVLGKKVDVLTYNSLYYLLREPILSEEVPIFSLSLMLDIML